MRKVGFGIIGLGAIAEVHAKALENMEDACLVCGFDPVPGRAEAFAKEHGCKGYDNLESFLGDPDLEVVTVATPSGMHEDGAVAAARARKHVIVEKPLEITKQRCENIIAACRENGVKLCGVFPSRYHASSRLLKKAIDEGRFGKIVMADAQIKWFRTQEYYDSGAWRGTWKFDGGGALMNQGIHAIDLLQWFMGGVEEVTAYAGTLAHERIEVEDAAVAILRFTNGAMGCIEGTTCAYPGFLKRIEILGTEGSAVLEEESLVKWEFKDERSDDAAVRVEMLNATKTGGGAADPRAIGFHGHQMLFESFVDSIINGKPVDITGESAKKAVEIIEAAYRSAKEHAPVKLPL